MKKALTILITLLMTAGLVSAASESALPGVDLPDLVDEVTAAEVEDATSSATMSARLVNQEAKQVIQEKKDQDLTETTGSKTDALASYLLEKPQDELAWYNFVQPWIRMAVNNGMPSSLIVLLILFPLVAALIAFSRHVVGLRGFGIYTPAVLSVAFVSTTIPMGIAIFILIVVVSVCLQRLLKRTNLAHLPKSAMILWGVCVSMIFFLVCMAYFDIQSFFTLSIFPLLMLISLSENFTSTQLLSTTKEAAKLTLETLLLAIVAALIIGSDGVQRFVIVNPEFVLVTTLVADWLIGQYNGLRLMELLRFKALIDKDA